jgi:phenylpyruvate tautomerase PptA (4-oxalocrotonate tautomerase family)
MPHVNIKHFPASLDERRQRDLITAVTDAVRTAFNCPENVISIALEPVAPEAWNDSVFVPEIQNRKALLHKAPNY